MNKKIFIIVDGVGRIIMGESNGNVSDYVIKLANPIVLKEMQKGNSIHLNFAPVFNTIDIEEATFKWTQISEAPQKLIDSYTELVNKLRAKKQGIEVVSSLPKDLKNVHVN